MSLSLDDKLLGEKVHYYCSSSEDEGDDDEQSGDEEEPRPAAPDVPPPTIDPYQGYSTNTGPKGVIKDWQKFKQLETESRLEREFEKIQLAKKLTLTCRTYEDDERARLQDEQFMEDIEKELEDVDDEFMKEYRQRRIEEMRVALENLPRFGTVATLSQSQFIEAIDSEQATVTIIIHLYEEGVQACEAMNGSLMCLAKEYPTIKFCRIQASETKLSYKFSKLAVPAILVYKNKELIGNFIQLAAELGEDFFATDVESFLLEHGMLPDNSLKAALLQNPNAAESETDSDYDVD